MYLKRVACPRKKCLLWKKRFPKELFILKKQLLGGGFALKKQLIWKEILRKGDCSKKETAPKKQLLWRYSYSKKSNWRIELINLMK